MQAEVSTSCQRNLNCQTGRILWAGFCLRSSVRQSHCVRMIDCNGDTNKIHRRRHVIVKADATSGSLQPSNSNSRVTWDAISDKLVTASSIPFSVLVLPQVIQNFAYIAAGNLQGLSVISWEGYLSGLLGNTLMCSHFANSGEKSAVNVQLLGIANNMSVLAQVAFASCMPKAVFAAVAAAVCIAISMSLARLRGTITTEAVKSQQGSLDAWQTWQLVSGVAGLAVVPQVLYNVMFPSAPSLMPGALCFAALAAWYAQPRNRMDESGKAKVEHLPGLASTLLFALSPLPQLVRNFVDAGSLEGLSVGTMLLALTGNALMVPRAMWVKDPVWMAGTTWAVCAGWGQLLSMFLKTSPSTGLRYLEPSVFFLVTAVLLTYVGWFLANTQRART